MSEESKLKPLIWIGSSKADFLEFPDEVKDLVGYALYVAQQGGKHADAKPLAGFGVPAHWRSSVTTVATRFRTVYTVRLAGRVYVLHAFQKKSKRGIKTPRAEMELVRARLRRAEQEHLDSPRRGLI